MNLSSILSEFGKIQNWDNAALTAASCLALGYLWKAIKTRWTPNEAIPPVCMLAGALIFAGLSGHKPDADFNWHFRAILIGFIIGFIVVLVHNFVLSRIEDYVALKINTLFGKSDPPKAP